MKLTAGSAMKATVQNGNAWHWKNRRGFVKDLSLNSYNDFVSIDGRNTLWGVDRMTNRWKRYPGGRTGVLAAAFGNDNTVWICRGNIIEKFIPFHSDKFKGRWVTIPGCCRDIDIGANGFVAVIGCDNHRWGFGIWRNLGGDGRRWARVDGQADRIAVGGRGQMVVKNRGRSIFWKYSYSTAWVHTSGAALDVAVTSNGRMVVIGTDHHVYWSRTIGPRPQWVKNNGAGYAISTRTLNTKRNLMVVGMDHQLWRA